MTWINLRWHSRLRLGVPAIVGWWALESGNNLQPFSRLTSPSTIERWSAKRNSKHHPTLLKKVEVTGETQHWPPIMNLRKKHLGPTYVWRRLHSCTPFLSDRYSDSHSAPCNKKQQTSSRQYSDFALRLSDAAYLEAMIMPCTWTYEHLGLATTVGFTLNLPNLSSEKDLYRSPNIFLFGAIDRSWSLKLFWQSFTTSGHFLAT